MGEVCIFVGGWLTVSLVAYSIYCFTSNKEKLEIYSVRAELKRIKRINDQDKNSIF